jgi:uncharacterized protein YjdB
MGNKFFKIALSMLLCITIIPVFDTDYAWATDTPVQSEEIVDNNQGNGLSGDSKEASGTENSEEELSDSKKGSENIDTKESGNTDGESDFSKVDEELKEKTDLESDKSDTQEKVLSQSLTDDQAIEAQSAKPYSVSYKAHVAYIGWQDWKKNGVLSGTTGQGRAIEALQLKLEGTGYSGAIKYRMHVAVEGWQGYVENGATSGTTGKERHTEAVSINLTGEVATYYDVYYRVHSAYVGWLGWTSNGMDAGTSGYGYGMEAIEIKLYPKGTGPVNSPNAFEKRPMTLESQAHVSNIGWQNWVTDGNTTGTTGHSLALEGLNVAVRSPDYSGSIEYRAHVQNVGWQNWKKDGQMAGSTGRGQQIEAIEMRLTGELAQQYDIYYRVHASYIGWMGWASNGQTAGIDGYSCRAEAVQIKLVKKGSATPTPTENHTVSLNYSSQGHSQNLGWLAKDGGYRTVGTTGKSLRLEALKLWIDNSSVSGGIEYRSHVGYVGWQNRSSNGALSGTEGQKKQIEAIQIRLTGDISKYFDVYYRAHVAGWGWNGWTKNGASAGTSKLGLPMEAMQIKIVAKGAAAPGSTSGAYWETYPIPATYRAMNSRVAGLSSPTGWLVAIDSRNCLVGVYSGSQGNWRNRYMWLCSPGAASTPTVKGIYSIGSRGYVFGSGYSCYWWTQFYGDYLFHSVLYYPGTNRIMEGTMGVPASQGCVRLDIGNAKWIYDNIPSGTTVLSY